MNMKKLFNLLKLSALFATCAFAESLSADSVSQATVSDTLASKGALFVEDSVSQMNASDTSAQQNVSLLPSDSTAPIKQSDAVLDSIGETKLETENPVAVEDSSQNLWQTSSDSLTKLGTPYANAYKKKRDKITFAEQDPIFRKKQDSILSVTLHHGVSVDFGRVYDKRIGNFANDVDWGTNLGFYYFYRDYIGSHVGYQGRFGVLYRYSRFEDQFDYGTALFEETNFDLVREQSTNYQNISIDVPLTLKFGGFVDRTSFLFVSITAGVTKSVYERITRSNTVLFKEPSAELSEKLEILTDLNLYPYTESHSTKEAFNADDWESNSWIGTGLDTKYVGINLQFLIAANSTSSNHRFKNIFHKSVPTWRLMIDFGLI